MPAHTPKDGIRLCDQVLAFLDDIEPPPLRVRGGRVFAVGQPIPPPTDGQLARDEEDRQKRILIRQQIDGARRTGLLERFRELAVAKGMTFGELALLKGTERESAWTLKRRRDVRDLVNYVRAACLASASQANESQSSPSLETTRSAYPARWYREHTLVSPDSLRQAFKDNKLTHAPGNGAHPHYWFDEVKKLWPYEAITPPIKPTKKSKA